MTICKAEGLSVNETTLQTVAAGANGDIRLVLGQLQMIRLRSKTLSYDDAKVVISPTNLHSCKYTGKCRNLNASAAHSTVKHVMLPI